MFQYLGPKIYFFCLCVCLLVAFFHLQSTVETFIFTYTKIEMCKNTCTGLCESNQPITSKWPKCGNSCTGKLPLVQHNRPVVLQIAHANLRRIVVGWLVGSNPNMTDSLWHQQWQAISNDPWQENKDLESRDFIWLIHLVHCLPGFLLPSTRLCMMTFSRQSPSLLAMWPK